jgi:hypothetical protein
MKLIYVTPQTEDELAPYVAWLSSLLDTLPETVRPDEDKREAVVAGYLGEVTIPYLQDLPLGCFIVELNKKSAEIHGITRPDLKDLIGKAAGPVIAAVGRKMLEVIFMEHERSLVFAKVPKESRGARGFLWRWGFRPMPDANTGVKLDKGRQVYVLPRTEFIKRYVGVR